MSASEERLRPHPAERFAGAERALDLTAALRALRAEARPSVSGHRQIALLHHGPIRLVLFAFEPGGHLPKHQTAGWVTIQVLRGSLRVGTPTDVHALGTGQILALAPDVPHDVAATDEADMLLGVYPETPMGSAM
jgi:quercetin dioxygenase-like cupin family protein